MSPILSPTLANPLSASLEIQDRIAVLFAVAAVAVPLSFGSANSGIARRVDDIYVRDIGVGVLVAGESDATGVKNTKREESSKDLGDLNILSLDVLGHGGYGDNGILKREEDIDILGGSPYSTDLALPILDVQNI
ncbi:hypothetical protein N7468_004965 [Penicillium chermesinum]|uniref:Uncharacterized protein n=1 Tax=Penicillium chermesinum TaxID=63820 RepID=A0A9W9NY97_9EURO|nr:uncharacterized protein N7468_004965 [Penicillium chermesinum]KAJ5232009.1 hypothetical protein N7468_004965 [Penicillium chermesinum]